LSKVFVLDTYQRPLNPVHPGRARILLSEGKAAVYKRFPFTIILKREIKEPIIEPLRIKLDPGSRTTGIAIVNDATGEVVFAAELTHRGQKIKAALDDRRAIRRSRRARKTRYRKVRWSNRKRKAGWLPPSLESRIANVLTWVHRLSRYCPITAISMELVRFDMQLMENAEVSGVTYQQGTLAGYETREYLLEKWQRACSYCGAKDTPLQIEHITPRAKGGTNRIANLCLACEPCNIAKGTQDIAVFLKKKPEVLKRIQSQAKKPLKDAAAVNTTRWALFERLKATGLPVETGSGGLTKYNRSTRELAKTHWLDAANVGKSTPQVLSIKDVVPLLITATGHGSRQMCLSDKYGFARTKAKGAKKIKGFQTGDMIKAIVTTGSKQGRYIGRVAVRSTGSFNIVTSTQTIQGISYRFCQMLHRSDGYKYEKGAPVSSPCMNAGVSTGD
jgi:5-methylcytosine-specific restriction endonuclease McrA